MSDASCHVCFIFSCFPPLFMGGVERYLINISKGLREYNVSSTILTRYYPPLPKKEQHEDFSLYRLGINPFPTPTTKRYINSFITLTGERLTYPFIGFYEALKIANKADLICPQLGYEADALLGIKLASKIKKSSIVNVHGRFGYESEDIPPTKKLMQSLQMASSAIVNRKSSYDFLFNNDLVNVTLMQNPIPVQEFKRPNGVDAKPRKTRALFIGRLSHRRGPDLAVSGFIKAAKQNPNIELWVVGEGELKASLIESVKAVGLSDRVIFFGKQLEVKKLLWEADIFLATSPIANFSSLSMREAMAAGLSVIATDVDETKTIVIPNETGVMVKPDSDSVADAILSLACNEQLRSKIAKSAEKFAEENFDMRLYCKRLSDIFHRADEN